MACFCILFYIRYLYKCMFVKKYYPCRKFYFRGVWKIDFHAMCFDLTNGIYERTISIEATSVFKKI